MHSQLASPAVNRALPTAQLGVEAAYLDRRYLAMQPEYEAMVRGVGIRPGWHVLDAGCGGGSHLPLLSTLIGATGRLHAIDQAAENIAAVEQLAWTLRRRSPLQTYQGSVLDLPLPANCVDAVWNANVSQYLTDSDLRTMLGEFRRVVRPGGLVAIKEIDATLFQVRPIPHRLFWRLFDAVTRAGVLQPSGCVRTPQLPQWMADAGLSDITANPVLITRRAPLRPVERDRFSAILQLLVEFAQQAAVSDDELERWRAYTDPDSPTFVLDDPALCWCETQLVVVGRVPRDA